MLAMLLGGRVGAQPVGYAPAPALLPDLAPDAWMEVAIGTNQPRVTGEAQGGTVGATLAFGGGLAGPLRGHAAYTTSRQTENGFAYGYRQIAYEVGLSAVRPPNQLGIAASGTVGYGAGAAREDLALDADLRLRTTRADHQRGFAQGTLLFVQRERGFVDEITIGVLGRVEAIGFRYTDEDIAGTVRDETVVSVQYGAYSELSFWRLTGIGQVVLGQNPGDGVQVSGTHASLSLRLRL